MATYYSAARFTEHARQQAALGQGLLDEHVPDGTACCRRCGRAHPCPDRRQGGELVVQFGHWGNAPAGLVRPYVGRGNEDAFE